MANKRGRKRMYATGAEKQLAYRERNAEATLIRRMRVELDSIGKIAEQLGKIQGVEYVCAAFPCPALLAQSIRERERTQGISAGEQARTFFLAGAEIVHRALDLAVAKASGGSGEPISADDQSKLVDALAGEVSRFVTAQVESRPEHRG